MATMGISLLLARTRNHRLYRHQSIPLNAGFGKEGDKDVSTSRIPML